MKKTILTFILLALTLVSSVSAVPDNFDIDNVYVNGIQVTEDNKVQVEIGSTATITILIQGEGDSTDIRLKAWLGGYEYDDIEVVSEVFEVQDGVSYKKTLSLEIPEDLDVSENEYTLHVEAYDSNDTERKDYTLYFESERHNVVVEDILLSSEILSPEDYLAVKVRLSNDGKKDEEDLKITVSIPELGVSNRVYMNELESGDQADAGTVYLTIPEDAKTGTYEVLVTVSYDNGYTESTDSTNLRIDGNSTVYDENAIVSIQTVKNLVVGEESSFKVFVTNLEDSTKEFSLTVSGMNADYTEDVKVSSDKTGELTFTLTPSESGLQTVLIEITSEDGVVEQELFNVDVEEKTNIYPITFAIVLAVLVVVGIVAYLRKLH
ncbi:MAG: hypothetical protein Q8Q35_00980 [Nanoarchaeota archaeon]|nr:hypothetical protein [Nanoarchaeota archaeon]